MNKCFFQELAVTQILINMPALFYTYINYCSLDAAAESFILVRSNYNYFIFIFFYHTAQGIDQKHE